MEFYVVYKCVCVWESSLKITISPMAQHTKRQHERLSDCFILVRDPMATWCVTLRVTKQWFYVLESLHQRMKIIFFLEIFLQVFTQNSIKVIWTILNKIENMLIFEWKLYNYSISNRKMICHSNSYIFRRNCSTKAQQPVFIKEVLSGTLSWRTFFLELNLLLYRQFNFSRR